MTRLRLSSVEKDSRDSVAQVEKLSIAGDPLSMPVRRAELQPPPRMSCRDDKKLLKHFCAPILISELNCALKQDQSSSLIILSISVSAEHNFPSILPSSSILELLQSIAQSNENEQQEGKKTKKNHHVMSQLRAEMKSRDRCSFNFLFQF